MAQILLIEDDVVMRETLSEVLKRKGYEVVIAENGAQGLRMFREKPADLVITDIIMPVKGGIQTIIDIQKDYPKVKIIAISGGGLGTAEEYLTITKVLSVRHNFKKPFSNEELLQAVKELIG